MKTLSLRLTDDMYRRLAEESRKTGASKSSIVRKAIEAAISNGFGEEGSSAFDLVADLCGSLKDGPVDLSYNPKYMEGYGK
ncbi:MAG: ribbon-helix-helix domain-containing protein [Planctomycetes bacterium]|nr:ribbon-helix-helix domain-containing protein [Planctomycetota bacterium]